MKSKQGTVYIVGAGPGDPGLLTVRGLQLLKRADVILYDRLASADVLKHAPKRARRVDVGKRPGHAMLSQDAMHARLIREARAGRHVVRLHGGDPFLFGRGGEEALALAAAQIPFEMVPGVSSALAVPAYAGIPVTHRGMASSVSIFTGHEDPTKHTQHRDWRQAARGRGTLVFLMGIRTLPQLVRDLRRAGRRSTTPCAIMAQGTTAQQRTVTGTLQTIVRRSRDAAMQPPAVIVVGDVAALREKLRWRGSRPLAGKRVLVTRPAAHASEFAALLEARGAHVIRLPAIVLRPLHAHPRMQRAFQQLHRYNWILFTSVEGVHQFMAQLAQRNGLAPHAQHIRVGAIGPKTAEAVRQAGLRLTCVPRSFHQEGMVAALTRYRWKGARVLMPRARTARMVLPNTLRQWGAQVDVVPFYEARPAPAIQQQMHRLLKRHRIDVVTFTSSQCVEQFVGALTPHNHRRLLNGATVASIGPMTSATARELGLRVAIEAREATVPALVDAIIAGAH